MYGMLRCFRACGCKGAGGELAARHSAPLASVIKPDLPSQHPPPQTAWRARAGCPPPFGSTPWRPPCCPVPRARAPVPCAPRGCARGCAPHRPVGLWVVKHCSAAPSWRQRTCSTFVLPCAAALGQPQQQLARPAHTTCSCTARTLFGRRPPSNTTTGRTPAASSSSTRPMQYCTCRSVGSPSTSSRAQLYEPRCSRQ